MAALVRQDNTAVGGRFASPRSLDGLEGPAADLPFLGLSLADRQERAFLEAGLELTPGLATDDPAPPEDRWRVLVREDVTLTRAAVEAMLAAAKEAGRDARWVLTGRAGNIAHDMGLGVPAEPWLVALMPGGPVTEERIDAAEPLDIDSQERLVEVPLPAGQFEAEMLELPLTERLVLPCTHWVQLLWANLLGLGPFLYRGLGGRNIVEVGVRLLGAVLGARSTDPMAVMAQYRRVGERTRIHPSAVVASSWIGDDVEIGPCAVVRGCVLGNGATIEALAHVEGSVVSAGARVQRQAMVNYCVLQKKAHAAGDMQLGVLDRGAALKKTAALMDQAIRGVVKVRAFGRLATAPLGLAGVGVGARTVVGANVFVAPGRTIPPDLVVVPPPSAVLSRISDLPLSGTVTIADGALVPLHPESGRDVG